MGYSLMKQRMSQSGFSPREEMIRDSQLVMRDELLHDASYSPTAYIWKYDDESNGYDDRLANIRIYNRKYSSINGNYQKFLTTYDNPIYIGDYIHEARDDTYWLVSESFNVNDTYYQGKMLQCNYLLRWQVSDGSIIQRLANIVSASKYDVGENGNSILVLSSNSYTVMIGYCDEGLELVTQRVFIDRQAANPTKVFKITRVDDVLYNADSMGSMLSYIADKDEINYSADNQELRLCDYFTVTNDGDGSHTDMETMVTTTIGGSSTLRVKARRTYSVSFTDADGDMVDGVNFKWRVAADFAVNANVDGNKVMLCVTDKASIGQSLVIQVLDADNGALLAEKTVGIAGVF